MSERKDDELDVRESPPAEGVAEQSRPRSPKPGKTKTSDAKPEQATAREAAGSATADRPPRAPRKSSARAGAKSASQPAAISPPLPVDQQDELPPHGDALMKRADQPKATKPRARVTTAPAPAPSALLPGAGDLARLTAAEHTQPHDVLGAHPLTVGGKSGVVIRAAMPNAIAVEAVLDEGQII